MLCSTSPQKEGEKILTNPNSGSSAAAEKPLALSSTKHEINTDKDGSLCSGWLKFFWRAEVFPGLSLSVLHPQEQEIDVFW